MIERQNSRKNKTQQLAETYYALNNHFTTKHYDYFKYKGRFKINWTIPERYIYAFQKLSRIPNAEHLLLANIINNRLTGGRNTIIQFVQAEGLQVFDQWKARNQSLTYQFKQHLTNFQSADQAILCSPVDQLPYMLQLLVDKKISIETATILSDIIEGKQYWDQHCVAENYTNLIMLIDKYTRFIEYDKPTFRKIAYRYFKEQYNS